MKGNKIVFLFVAFTFSLLLIVSIRGKKGNIDYKDIKSFSELSKEVENLEKVNRELKSDIYLKEVELFEMKKNEDENEKTIVSKLNAEMEELREINGNKTLKGEGITLTIDDNKTENIEGRNINDDLIHDEDIQILINDLKKAGAEAISINNQRLTSTSEIKCGGPVIRINKKTYTNPFIIKVIGNKDKLEEAVIKKDTYGYILKNIFKIQIEVKKEENMIIEKHF